MIVVVVPENIEYSVYIPFKERGEVSKILSQVAIDAGFRGYCENNDMHGSILFCFNKKSCWYPHFGSKDKLIESDFGGDKYLSIEDFLKKFCKHNVSEKSHCCLKCGIQF